jgi:SAM-dependent methyltransferase
MDKQSFANISPDELALCCRKYANECKVKAAVHPNDFIFRFILTHPTFPAIENDLSVDVTQRREMLEFASGYGCVTRHLRAVFPAFEIVSSDIHSDANRFITKELGERSIQSSPIPESFDSAQEYDLVFALSFFSHMPARTWSRWLLALFKILRRGGSLIFTTHGLISDRKIPMATSMDEKGFYFRPGSEQDDLDQAEYGTTVTSCSFVVEQIEALENCELRLVRAGLWWGHQDLYVANKR